MVLTVIISGTKTQGQRQLPNTTQRIFRYYDVIDRTFMLNAVFKKPFVFKAEGKVGYPFPGKHFFYVVSHENDISHARTRDGKLVMDLNFGKVVQQTKSALSNRVNRYYNTMPGNQGKDPFNASHLHFLASGSKLEVEAFEDAWIKLIKAETGDKSNATAVLESEEMFRQRAATFAADLDLIKKGDDSSSDFADVSTTDEELYEDEDDNDLGGHLYGSPEATRYQERKRKTARLERRSQRKAKYERGTAFQTDDAAYDIQGVLPTQVDFDRRAPINARVTERITADFDDFMARLNVMAKLLGTKAYRQYVSNFSQCRRTNRPLPNKPYVNGKNIPPHYCFRAKRNVQLGTGVLKKVLKKGVVIKPVQFINDRGKWVVTCQKATWTQKKLRWPLVYDVPARLLEVNPSQNLDFERYRCENSIVALNR